MFSVENVVMISIGAVLFLVWIFLFFKGLRNASLFENIEEKEYPLKEIFFVGYAFMEIIRYQYKGKKNRSLRKELAVLYGEKYVEFYIRVVYAQRVTYALTLATLGFVLYGFANDILLSVIIVIFSALAFYYYGVEPAHKIEKRSELIMKDFSNVVSQLALLSNAGMIMKEAWEQVANNGESTLYLEMQKAVDEMNNGLSEADALYRFGQRCVLPEIKKFTSTIIQGIEKGNSELTSMLQKQSAEVWDVKKQIVKQQGEKAASKLLIPMLVMFLGIIIMIVIPIFTNMGV